MPRFLARLLESVLFTRFALVVLTFCFWGSGLAKLADFPAAVAEMAFFGLQPAAPIAVLVIATQLGGSLLLITGIKPWLGAGALGVFTALTIPLVHHFWSLEGEAAIAHFHTATEHVTVIGGLMVAAILSHRLQTARNAAIVTAASGATRYQPA
ncbi:DoxX family protein [Aureimonas jatrophae]|uniref:Transmembrane protein n=1 Tax=Aureimonas jatrophae TaxID=1166073 RepID=A0A1H0LH91_9HYPH|nr:DoxX family protein [Aureimonas jatrophae]MBB3952516.1 transmembrane protein [Aureimonas jatrophae]SDO67455.1 transmembrane protein [Aureimonas jatrophae]